MEIAISPCRYAPGGLKILLGCFLLCILASLPALAQADSLTPITADLNGYAQLSFYVPSGVAVEPQALEEANYTEGREVKAIMLVNGSRVSLHLLYPCQASAALLEPDGLKTALNAYNSGMTQAVYNPSPLNISGQSALWGQVGKQIFVAYQPSVQTIALALIDESLDENTLQYLLGSLNITVNKGSSPLWPGYCPDTSASKAAPAKTVDKGIAAASKMLENGPEVEEEQPAPTVPESNKDRMAADMAAAQERLNAAKNKFKGF